VKDGLSATKETSRKRKTQHRSTLTRNKTWRKS